MENKYRLGTFPTVTLPANLTWREDPFHDWNWDFQFHTLRYTLDLMKAARLRNDSAYRNRAIAILRDWIHDNPRHAAPSVWSWNDHATAWRAIVLACTADMIGMPTWLHDALMFHGHTLADPTFYRYQGNHALNQAMALLEVGRVLHRSDLIALAGRRINTLIVASVDAQGVTNEQSIGYELYNYVRYTRARERMRAAGLPVSTAFLRLQKMPQFLAHATLPNGHYEMIGDTVDNNALAIAGTAAEYAATRGASGPRPSQTITRYTAGYLLVRSGWGEARAEADETSLAVKYGRGPVFHGHADGMELTLSAYGSRLLIDPGMYSYTPSVYRTFFKGRSAHDVVTVDGKAWTFSSPTRLLHYATDTRFVDVTMQGTGFPGVTHTRRITYSRAMDFILVDDRLSSSTSHIYRQLWHLPEDARPAISGTSVWTQRARGNVLIRQLAATTWIRIVTGRTSPVQGWISYRYGTKVAAPVEEAVQGGSTVRFLTLIVPAVGHPSANVSAVHLTSTGYTATVKIGGHAERVTVSGTSCWMTILS